MSSIFAHTKSSPYHLSVGVVLMNDEGEVACHHHTNALGKGLPFNELYLLMRETVEDGESLYDAVARGLQEEFGLSGEVERYLGSTRNTIHAPNGNYDFEKTTVYFLCKYTGAAAERDQDDPESGSDIEWIKPANLAANMNRLAVVFNNEPLDESEILERI
jgi:8-oxo-dGTP pyrophosphatase MutT (NUDIX family)